jgi:hypothetical protein
LMEDDQASIPPIGNRFHVTQMRADFMHSICPFGWKKD